MIVPLVGNFAFDYLLLTLCVENNRDISCHKWQFRTNWQYLIISVIIYNKFVFIETALYNDSNTGHLQFQ